MANRPDSSHGPASFWTQANALLRKNLTFQKRNMGTNIRLVSFPILFCLLLFTLQTLVNKVLDEQPKTQCTCSCVDIYGDGKCKQVCKPTKSDNESYTTPTSLCPIPSPAEIPPLLQIPIPKSRAVSTDLYPSTDFPDESCRAKHSCPAIALFSGNNQSLGQSLAQNIFTSSFINGSTYLDTLAINAMGSLFEPYIDKQYDSTAYTDLLSVQSKCPPNSTLNISDPSGNQSSSSNPGGCVEGLCLWRNSSSEINNVLYKSYWGGNSERKVNEIFAAYDFLDSDVKHLNVNVWYNSTCIHKVGWPFLNSVRVPRALSLVSNAYIHLLRGPETRILLEFLKEMPTMPTNLRLDIASLLATLLFSWVILQLFPVILGSLMYEKQQNLRIMMKMHGLGDGAYWLISYAYFLSISSVYMLCFIIFGSVLGLKFFTLNGYSIQAVFYFIYINLQISVALLVAALFSNVRTATVIGYMGVFGTGLLGEFLFKFFIEAASFPRGWIIVMELYPGFSLYRGLYEFGQSSYSGNYSRTKGLVWGDLNDSQNGLREVMIIMFAEWWVLMFVAYYVDQVVSAANGVRRSPLFFLQRFQEKRKSSLRRASLQRQGSKAFDQMEKADVLQEIEKVEQLLQKGDLDHAIISDNLTKIYPGRDGNPEKIAVRGMSLALPRGECFGLLGPNGAGKTSFINMMIGLANPTSGTAYVHGMDIQREMDSIYTSMGVCSQHDLLWETLTGREHLLFYGRLKNLKGTALTQAVEESLRSVNLFHGGVADKKAGEYSGGMKRRLSVAISLIGDPKVVYMDEPGTGLDPASRNNLWSVVKRAKHNRAIVLTTHSMEEAEVLCDRLGIFVDGSLQCIGNPKELKGRYGGSYVLTMTTSSTHEEEVENLVSQLSPGAKKVYQISGTQKFEMPKQEVRIADVLRAVEHAKSCFGVQAWGLCDSTLEDVFIKVARGTLAPEILS